MTTKPRELDRIVLEFKDIRETKRTHVFEEQLGDQAYSDQDVAVGALYVKTQALEMLGMPTKIRVTIEPIE